RFLRAVLRYAAARGADVTAALATHRLPAALAEVEDASLPVPKMHALLDDLAARTGDPFLGLHVAQSLPRGNYGLVEYICRTAPTLSRALAQLCRLIRLMNPVEQLEVREANGQTRVTHRLVGVPGGAGRHGNEYLLALLVTEARAMA